MVADSAGEHCNSVKYCPAIVARHRFDQMLEQVERGDTVLIHRGGRIVAQFSPPSEAQCDRPEADSKSLLFQERVAETGDGKPTNVTREETLAWRHEGHKR